MDIPFYYNNVDNLVIAINETNEESNTYMDRYYVSQSDINMSAVVVGYDEMIDVDNLPEIDNYMGGLNTVYRPNIRIQMELAPLAPQELAVSASGYASWIAPSNVGLNREFINYNILLNNELVGTTTDLFGNLKI